MIARKNYGKDGKSTSEIAFRKKINKAYHCLVFIVQGYGAVVKCNKSYKIIKMKVQFIYELD